MVTDMAKAKEKQPNRIALPKPIQRAFYAGVGLSLGSIVLGVPIEHIPRVAAAGACYSIMADWHNLGLKPYKRKRQVIVNGSRRINLEYSLDRGGYIARETYLEAMKRLLTGAKAEVPPRQKAQRPSELDSFTFVSDGLQLREEHVKLFLRSAWRNRQYGRGLSARHWVRNFNRRPLWYKELSPAWFYAMRQLLFDAEAGLGVQVVIVGGNQWLTMANEPHLTMRLLKWYECEK